MFPGKVNICLVSLSDCCGLNENELYRLICLNAWSPVSGTGWEGLRSVTLLEEVCHWEIAMAIPGPVSVFLTSTYR